MTILNEIKSRIIRYLKQEELKDPFLFHYGIVSTTRGWLPDIFVIYKGKPIFFDVVRPGVKRSKLQIDTITDLQQSGAIVREVHYVQDVVDFFIWYNNKISIRGGS